ncbi:type IV toxin-antitoxin system AbiEi family antitoxin domain-containing protein [Patescibacteria group bacterium]|nr:type IV toxin-antitoxin system AbiEi family antitoxin domain-containing protein [Patescibacteria group bacterium]MBP9710237.1 type IV toxin-antitoxin system AbiEi family antitoxin domain-containing protein [Patescibacteria group bacterium]
MSKLVNKEQLFSSERLDLAKIAQIAKLGILTTTEAAMVLNLDPQKASLKLTSWVRRGWLRRIKRGVYLIPPLEAEPSRLTTPEDSWVLAHKIFYPCYIGGWSAAEHWNLTEQLFRSTLVVTGANIRQRKVNLLGNEFIMFKVQKNRLEGMSEIWRGNVKVMISSKERTIADCLQNPEWCGGIRHLAEIYKNYKQETSADFDLLLSTIISQTNGAALKRFGYLSDLIWPEKRHLLHTADIKLTQGNVKLDPSINDKGKLNTAWKIWVNSNTD